MAKTAKLKKRTTTPHSRAARRAVSPSIDLDKSLKNLPLPQDPPTSNSQRNAISKAAPKPHVLAAQTSGISKRKTNTMKRQQRLRQIKGMERAADAMDKFEVKVQKSVGKERKVKDRAKQWEDINGEKAKVKGGEGNTFGALAAREWISDEEMSEVEGGAGEKKVAVPIAGGPVKEVVVPASILLPTADEDELL